MPLTHKIHHSSALARETQCWGSLRGIHEKRFLILPQLLGSLSRGEIIPDCVSIQQNPLLQNSWHPLCHSGVTCFHLHITDVTCCLTLSMYLEFP